MNDNNHSYLYDRLLEYCSGEAYPLHMPGHKRRLGTMADPFSFDITEIDGFDDLHHAGGILKEAQERAAELYGAKKTYFLVNGSTAGILSAVGTCCRRGGRLLMARNSHRSVWHAAYLYDLDTGYLWPEQAENGWINGRINPDAVEKELEAHPETEAVCITSPTYDGVVSDIRRIADIVHDWNVPLIVDEAHGAHFGFHPAFPQSAVRLGADLVIQSVHKTLPSLTQTALLHVCSRRIDRKRLERMLRICQTSSPSYVLMASIDQCIRLMKEQGADLMEQLAQRLERFRFSLKELRILSLIRSDDPSRILISGAQAGLSGMAICDILRERYQLELEMAAVNYALALTGAGDDEEGLVRLSLALQELDRELFLNRQFPQRSSWLKKYMSDPDNEALPGEESRSGAVQYHGGTDIRPKQILRLAEAWDAPGEPVLAGEASGKICGEFICLYPPGIPQLVPGEQILPEQIRWLEECLKSGYTLQGMEDETGRTIRVLSS